MRWKDVSGNPEYTGVPPMLPVNSIPLHEKFFKESDHTVLEHPCP